MVQVLVCVICYSSQSLKRIVIQHRSNADINDRRLSRSGHKNIALLSQPPSFSLAVAVSLSLSVHVYVFANNAACPCPFPAP